MARQINIQPDVSVEGLKELERALETREGRLAQALEAVVEETARSVQSEARSTVPIDTGTLRDSIAVKVEGMEGEIFIARGAHYGQFIEFGTSSRREHPFMGPAAERERKWMQKRVEDAVERAVE